MNERMSTEGKSVYRYGAEKGVGFGIYMTLMSIGLIYSPYNGLAALLSLAMMIAVPAILYIHMRRYHTLENGITPFAALWMLGIVIFLSGSMICGLATYVWLQYVTPTYIHDIVVTVIDTYKGIGDASARQMTEILQSAIDNHMLPSPIVVVVQMIMFSTFTGSVLSMILSLIVRMRRVSAMPPK